MAVYCMHDEHGGGMTLIDDALRLSCCLVTSCFSLTALSEFGNTILGCPNLLQLSLPIF